MKKNHSGIPNHNIRNSQQTSSTLAAVFAEVSMKIKPCSRANDSP